MARTAIRLQLVLAAMLFGASTARTAAESPDHAGERIVDCRLGWDNQYKVGYWTPMWVDVAGGRPATARLEVTVRDPDGVQTTVAATPDGDAARSPVPSGRLHSTLLYVKIGRIQSEVNVALAADGQVVDRVTLEPGPQAGNGRILPGLPPTAELLVALGPVDLSAAFPDRDAENGELARRSVHLPHAADLPTEWFGYEGVDILVLSTGDLELCRELATDGRRLAALRRWVELGGRLVVLCGRHAPELLADSEPLAALVPGTFVQTVRLTETSPIEHFSQSEIPITSRGARTEIVAAQLRGVAGRIDAFAGGRPTDLPLVVRAPRGLGELAFVSVDLDAPPLADWQGRDAFLRALLRPYVATSDQASVPRTLVTLGYNDLSGALRQRLGRSFNSVTTVTFPIVALLVIGYLILLGPGDYFLVHKLGRRPWLAWVTFPLLVVATSGGAYWLAQAHQGRVSVNQLELVDVDLTTGQARGTYWAALYSPQTRRYDLAVVVRLPGGRTPTGHETLLSWLGLPGTGLGGMHATSVGPDIIPNGYRFTPQLDALVGLPVLASSTKSLSARWTAPVGPLVSAQLAEDADGLLVGSVTNQTGQPLTDARLLYGSWAYRLGDLLTGRPIRVGQQTDAIQVKTLVTRAARGDWSRPGGGSPHQPFFADRASADELLSLMMFYEAAGGYGFTDLANRYQSYCDFSRLLYLGRAILVAGSQEPGSTLVDQTSGKPLRGSQDQTKVVYRFLLPVKAAK